MSYREKALTPKQIAALCKVGVTTVYRWIFEGRLPATRRLGRYFVRESDLDKLYEPVGGRPNSAAEVQRSEATKNRLRDMGLLP